MQMEAFPDSVFTDGYKLYNLKKDIGQQENLADKYPKKLGEMINRFEYLKSTTNKVTRY